MIRKAKSVLRELFQAAVDAASPAICLPPYLPEAPRGRTVVIGAGKAAASMAKAVEDHWKGTLSGLVVTRYGHAVPCRQIEVIEAAHPVPDTAGQIAAQRILDLVTGLSSDDLVLCLISGGGSALLSSPAPGLSLEDKQRVNKALLLSGATISEINCARKHLSAIKGGRLAAACAPARVVTLLISDVPGDDPSIIASGPTVEDPSTSADAFEILDKYQIHKPAAILKHLRSASAETPKPGDTKLANNEVHIIACARDALLAAAEVGRKQGYQVSILGDSIEGEARDVAREQAEIVKQIVRHQHKLEAPCLLLSGGETTVTVRGGGRGGRNTEFALALAIALDGLENVFAIACDTDGIDGTEDNAGVIISPDTLRRAAKAGLDAHALLADNDGYRFFHGLGDLVMTGPTLTNVNDLRAILIATNGNA